MFNNEYVYVHLSRSCFVCCSIYSSSLVLSASTSGCERPSSLLESMNMTYWKFARLGARFPPEVDVVDEESTAAGPRPFWLRLV